MKSHSHAKGGFTLIELLTVIAIVAILSAILVPTVGQFRTLAKKTSDANDLRRIVQASQMFAAQNGEKFVDTQQSIDQQGIVNSGGSTIVHVAAVLAVGGELNDPEIWVSENEKKDLPGGAIVSSTPYDALIQDSGYQINSSLAATHFSFDYVTGLATWMPSTTPVAFSRMADTASSTWGPNDVYQQSGGHVAFVGGNVSWYETLDGKLVAPDGSAADTIANAVPDVLNIRQSAPQP